MQITVRLFASVREVVGTRSQVIEVPDGATVGDVWQIYVDQHPRLARLNISYAVNHEYSGLERVLKDGDEVAFIPPVSGG